MVIINDKKLVHKDQNNINDDDDDVQNDEDKMVQCAGFSCL